MCLLGLHPKFQCPQLWLSRQLDLWWNDGLGLGARGVFFCLSQKSQLSYCDRYITMTCQWQRGSQALISWLVCSQFFLRQCSFFRSAFGAELQHMEQTVTCCCSLAWPLVEVSWGRILNLQSTLNFCACVSGCNFFFFCTRVHGHLKWKVLCFPQWADGPLHGWYQWQRAVGRLQKFVFLQTFFVMFVASVFCEKKKKNESCSCLDPGYLVGMYPMRMDIFTICGKVLHTVRKTQCEHALIAESFTLVQCVTLCRCV